MLQPFANYNLYHGFTWEGVAGISVRHWSKVPHINTDGENQSAVLNDSRCLRLMFRDSLDYLVPSCNPSS